MLLVVHEGTDEAEVVLEVEIELMLDDVDVADNEIIDEVAGEILIGDNDDDEVVLEALENDELEVEMGELEYVVIYHELQTVIDDDEVDMDTEGTDDEMPHHLLLNTELNIELDDEPLILGIIIDDETDANEYLYLDTLHQLDMM